MFVSVIIDIANKNVDNVFTYTVEGAELPNDFQNLVGYRCIVPFGKGNKNREGFILSVSHECQYKRVKSITIFPDKDPVFSKKQIELALFIKKMYFCTTFDALKLLKPIGVNVNGSPTKFERFVVINKEEGVCEKIEKTLKRDSKQSDIIRFLEKKDKASIAEIKEYFDITNAPIDALIKKGILLVINEEVRRTTLSDYSMSLERTYKKELTNEQKNALEEIIEEYDKEIKMPVLLHGVTGSGKTEVYLQIIEEVIKRGQSAIVLVPEISLTPQVVNIFVSRFPDKVSVTHSRLSTGERFDQWKRAYDNEISIMIGPRSSIFTPFNNLGVVIIDEEHERTYKSETTPKYDTIEVAKKLCQINNALLVLGSATPRLDSYKNAMEEKYRLIEMKNRVNFSFPICEVVDMTDELKKNNKSIFSEKLQKEMVRTLDDDKQIILFLNRRGFSNFVSCRMCGQAISCTNCNVNYTYHKDSGRLVCHYCNQSIRLPELCPSCGSKHIRPFGIGTQKVEEEVRKLFPNESILRMDLDTTTKKNSHEEIISKFRNKDSRILIGTQMIAKGLDFSDVTLVGVIASDLSLFNGDYKGAENTFSLITQVAGRAGRSEHKGKVIIQTYNNEHYAITHAKNNDYISFYKEEICYREQMDYPPFTNIFNIMFTSHDEKRIIMLLHRLNQIMHYYNRKGFFTILNPAPDIISKVKNRYRWRIMIKGKDRELLVQFCLFALNKLEMTETLSDITISLNID